ncbi:MAG: hypothetical protein HKN73_20885 [Gemmatimonadetes bacterium]|nr:hypothetical protein [Gemmatimonadota bacterium]
MPGLLAVAFQIVPACAMSQDQETEAPDSVLVLASTRAAVDIVGPLPELSRFLPDGLQSQAGIDWERSWDVGAAEGRRLREEVYAELRQSGFEVDSAGAYDASASVDRALEPLGVPSDLPLHLSLPLAEARSLADRARGALSMKRWNDAALFALQAGDALREVMPRTVALTLIEAGEAALRTHLATRPEERVTGVTVEAARRASRLLQWARSAIAGGSERRAVQRAYYACRLLGVVLP